jgi:DNA-binding response OmpR family regulator
VLGENKLKRIQGKILVVEDDADASRAITSALEEAGYEVSTASEGVEGLNLATTKQPWLIVLDALLPGMDGLEVCSRLRSDGRTKEVPILMLSEKAREADRAVAMRIGADDYLAKPVDPAQVVDLTQQLIVEKQGAHSRIVAFIGCKGGVGTSTVAANVALCAAEQGIATLLLDPSAESKALPSILGLDVSKGEDWMFDGFKPYGFKRARHQ